MNHSCLRWLLYLYVARVKRVRDDCHPTLPTPLVGCRVASISPKPLAGLSIGQGLMTTRAGRTGEGVGR